MILPDDKGTQQHRSLARQLGIVDREQDLTGLLDSALQPDSAQWHTSVRCPRRQ